MGTVGTPTAALVLNDFCSCEQAGHRDTKLERTVRSVCAHNYRHFRNRLKLSKYHLKTRPSSSNAIAILKFTSVPQVSVVSSSEHFGFQNHLRPQTFIQEKQE